MTTERRTQDRRVSPAVGQYAIQECAKLRALNAELVEALQLADKHLNRNLRDDQLCAEYLLIRKAAGKATP